MRKERAWIGSGRGNLDLRLLLDGLRRGMLRAKRPARSQEHDKEHGEKSEDKFDGGIRRSSCARAGAGNAGNLRHFRFEAVRWGLVGHLAAP